jgi:hypothetical protein
MTIESYSIVRSRQTGRWCLLDTTGRIRGETTDPDLIPDLIAAFQMAAILEAICARTGMLIQTQARYQCAEDEFDQFGD